MECRIECILVVDCDLEWNVKQNIECKAGWSVEWNVVNRFFTAFTIRFLFFKDSEKTV